MHYFKWTSVYISIFLAMLLGSQTMACTIFVFTQNGKTYFCNNEDWRDPITEIRFNPAKEGDYAWVYFGFSNNWAQGGVNEHGLCFDWYATGGPFGWKSDPNKQDFRGNLSEELLRKCKNVDEAIEFYKKYNEKNLEGAVTLIADKEGNSVLVHWLNGNLVLEKNQNSFQSCGVGKAAVDAKLQNVKSEFKIDMLAAALSEGSAKGEFGTKYSNIVSLRDGKCYLFQNRDYGQYLEIDFARKLKGPAARYEITDLFSNSVSASDIEVRQGKLIESNSGILKTGNANQTEQPQSPELEAIRNTLNDYIEGSTNGHPDRLRKAFHPDLNLYSIGSNGKLKIWSGTDYINDTKKGQPTGEVGRILSIDFENDIAVAKVEISNPKSSTPYIDYFMLLKVEGKWTIVHKMYTKKTVN